ELGGRERRPRLEAGDADEVVPLVLPRPPARVHEPVPARPDERPELVAVQADLLRELALERMRVGLPCLDAAAGCRPPRPEVVFEADEQRTPRLVEHERAAPAAKAQPARAPGELLEPAEPPRPRHRGVCRRRRRAPDELRLPELPRLQPELGPLAERAAVRLLPDEGEPPRP